MNRNVDEMVKMHSEDAGNGTLANVMTKAATGVATKKEMQNSNTSVATSSNDLPDIPESITVLSDEELATAAEEAQKKKIWAENAGAMKFALLEEMKRIHSKEGWYFVKLLVERDEEITAQLEKIDGVCDKNLHKHVEFSEFLNFVRGVDSPEKMDKVVSRLIDEVVNKDRNTRYRIALRDEVHRLKSVGAFPEGGFYWKDKCYFPYKPFAGEQKSSGQKALEAEIMKTIRKLSLQRKEKIVRKMNSLRRLDANDNLNGILDNREGLYKVINDPVMDEVKKRKVVQHGGVAIIRVVNRGKEEKSFFAIEPVDGAGCFNWISGEAGKWWVPVSSAIFAKLPNSVPEEVHDKVLRLACALNKHLYPLHKKRKESCL